jgi:hypothetical protein
LVPAPMEEPHDLPHNEKVDIHQAGDAFRRYSREKV